MLARIVWAFSLGSAALAAFAVAECPQPLGRWGYGSARAAAISGSTALLGNGAVLEVVDVANPATPVVLSSVTFPGLVSGIAVQGSTAFVAAGRAGLRIVDLTTPTSPVELGLVDTPGDASGVAVDGTHAFVADNQRGVRVIDVSSLSSPLEVASVDGIGGANGVAVAGGFAYVALSSGALLVLDVSAPASPAQVVQLDTPGITYGVAVSGSHVLLADGVEGLRVIDVASPAAPVEVGRVDTPGNAYAVAVSGTLAFVADGGSGLRVIDFSVQAAPVEVGSLDPGGEAVGVAVSGTLAIVAAGWTGMHIVNVTTPASPVEVGAVAGRGRANRLAVSGAHAFVADGSAGLRILDVSNPAAPAEVGALDTTGTASDVAVSGGVAYVTDQWQGLRIVDVSAPGVPVDRGALALGAQALSVAVDGAFAYVGTDPGGLHIIDVTTPATPVEVGSVALPGAVWSVRVSGSHAYLAAGASGLRIVDVSSPASPVVAGFLDTPSTAMGVAVAGSLVYLADTGSGVRVIDVSDPANPVEVGLLAATTWAQDVVVAGDRLLVANDGISFAVASLVDPDSPELVGSTGIGWSAFGVAASGTTAYVADSDAGVAIFDVSACPATLCTLQCAATATPASGPAPLDVSFAATVTPAGCNGAAGYRWGYGDGSPDSLEQAPSHQYLAPGVYSWSFTATLGAASCSDGGTITVAGAEITVLDGGSAIPDGQATAVAFGSISQGGPPPARTFTVRNDGVLPLILGPVTVPAGFVLVEGLAASLAPGALDTFTVQLDSAAAGARDGQIAFATNDADENPFNFAIAGTVTPPAPRRFDFGTPTSPVGAGYTGVTPASAYTGALGYGWTAGVIAARDRASSIDPTRDFNFTHEGTFVLNLPNGEWNVAVTLGDVTAPHDLMGVFLEGALADTVTLAANHFSSRAYRTTVADNQLTVLLRDLGGTDANVVINALAVTPAPPRRFDFGTASSPVAAGFLQVTPTTTYSPAAAFGWLSGSVGSRDRGTADNLTRDLNFTPLATFVVDLANGSYDVTVTMGDVTQGRDQMGVFLEGAQVDTVTTSANHFATRTYRVLVADEQLTLLLHDLGGFDGNAVINAMEVVAAPPPRKLDFGTPSSPVAAGYTRVVPATVFNPLLGYGWVSGTISARDRGTGSALTRDLNYTRDGSFAVAAPDGAYDVIITMGDATTAHDQMEVFLQGNLVATVTTQKNQFSTATYHVTITGGQLTLRLHDAGGSDPNAVINALEVK